MSYSSRFPPPTSSHGQHSTYYPAFQAQTHSNYPVAPSHHAPAPPPSHPPSSPNQPSLYFGIRFKQNRELERCLKQNDLCFPDQGGYCEWLQGVHNSSKNVRGILFILFTDAWKVYAIAQMSGTPRPIGIAPYNNAKFVALPVVWRAYLQEPLVKVDLGLERDLLHCVESARGSTIVALEQQFVGRRLRELVFNETANQSVKEQIIRIEKKEEDEEKADENLYAPSNEHAQEMYSPRAASSSGLAYNAAQSPDYSSSNLSLASKEETRDPESDKEKMARLMACIHKAQTEETYRGGLSYSSNGLRSSDFL